MAKERRGVELVITKTDNQQIRGELIAVKASSLLVLDSKLDTDVSIEIGNITSIKIVKKSRGFIGAIVGFAVGAGAALATDYEYATDPEAHGLLVCVGGGLSVGWIAGEAMGRGETIQTKGKPKFKIREILEKLRRQARVPNAQ